MYLHDEIWSEGANVCNSDARFCRAIGCSYTYPNVQYVYFFRSLSSSFAIHPNTMEKAMPAMPRKGANFGASSYSDIVPAPSFEQSLLDG